MSSYITLACCQIYSYHTNDKTDLISDCPRKETFLSVTNLADSELKSGTVCHL